MGDQQAPFDPAAVLARLDQLEQRNDRLEADNAALRARVAALPGADPVSGPTVPGAEAAPVPGTPGQGVGRRQALRTGLAVAGAAVAAGAVLLDASPAAAANGDPIVAGVLTNAASAPTNLVVSGNANYGFAASDSALFQPGETPALVGYATGSSFSTALMGITSVTDDPSVAALVSKAQGVALGAEMSASNNYAVLASNSSTTVPTIRAVNYSAGTGVEVVAGTVGVNANCGNGIAVLAQGATGAYLYGANVSVLLTGPPGRLAPTLDQIAHRPGELVQDGSGNLWLCTVVGTPGTFRKVGGPATAGAFHALRTPVRVYDSRPGTSPNVGSKTPLPANTARTIDLKANSSSVPAGASAVALNVLLLNATAGNGNFTVWANGAARPLANTLVWGGSAGRFSTFALTGVDASAQCQVLASLKTDLTVDVAGYYQ